MATVNGVPVLRPPPEGYVVDFENPRQQYVIPMYCTFGVGVFLALCFLFQRLYVQWFVRRKLAWEDIVLLGAWISSIIGQALIIHGVADKYVGVHIWEVPLPKVKDLSLHIVFLMPLFYVIMQALAKVVILAFYLKLGYQSRSFLWTVYFTMFANAASGIGITLCMIFGCRPLRKGWDISVTEGTCLSRPALYNATTTIGLITDAMVILVPVPMVMKLHTSRSKKIGIILMFAVGGLTLVTSIVRLHQLIVVLDFYGDPPWGAGPVCVWVCAEANLLIICACFPTVRTFIRSVAPGLLSSNNRSPSDSKRRGLSETLRLRSRSRPRRNAYEGFDLDQLQTFVTSENHDGNGSEESAWHEDGIPRDAILQTKTMDITTGREVP